MFGGSFKSCCCFFLTSTKTHSKRKIIMSLLSRASKRLVRPRNFLVPKTCRTSLSLDLGLPFYTDPLIKSNLSSATSTIEVRFSWKLLFCFQDVGCVLLKTFWKQLRIEFSSKFLMIVILQNISHSFHSLIPFLLCLMILGSWNL